MSQAQLCRDEFQRDAVDAVAQAGRLGAILKDMSLMPLATCAVDFGPRESQFVIGSGFDHPWIDWLPEAGPAGPAVELVFRRKEGQVASRTIVDTGSLVIVHVVGKGALGMLMP